MAKKGRFLHGVHYYPNLGDHALYLNKAFADELEWDNVSKTEFDVEADVPVTNYGMAIAYIHGIFNRAVAPFLSGQKDDNLYL